MYRDIPTGIAQLRDIPVEGHPSKGYPIVSWAASKSQLWESSRRVGEFTEGLYHHQSPDEGRQFEAHVQKLNMAMMSMRIPGLRSNTIEDTSDSESSIDERDDWQGSSETSEALPPPSASASNLSQSVPILQSPFSVQTPQGQPSAQGSNQTPPQSPHTAALSDLEATPKASNFGSRSSTQPSPLSAQVPPARATGKKRRAADPTTPSSSKAGNSNPDQENGADTIKVFLDHQTRLMTQLYDGIKTSKAELVTKQNEQIGKLTDSVQQNSSVLSRILDTLDIMTAKNKGKQRGGSGDFDKEEHRPGGGSGTGTSTATDNHAAAANEGDSHRETPAFTFRTTRKGSARSGAVKHRPLEELKNKEMIRKWLNEVMVLYSYLRLRSDSNPIPIQTPP
ncbi:hypothetical protein C8R42DRAFT_646352 [Lentinula raphanica]|nr:hypothetical protein C8R42DRAFT_646352 [Lentinula raphanica]